MWVQHPFQLWHVEELEGSADCNVAGSKVMLLLCGCVEKSPKHQHCSQSWVATCLVRRALADLEDLGQKGTKEIALHVLAEVVVAEPRAFMY